ncbi:hypothetical protein ES703_30336 [subsurface metagenome]
MDIVQPDVAKVGGLSEMRRIAWMAEEHGMIEPFEGGQVRSRGGDRLISYGTSSYGYDVRCSRAFKVFTNINSATSNACTMMRNAKIRLILPATPCEPCERSPQRSLRILPIAFLATRAL